MAFDIIFFVLGRRPNKSSDEITHCLRTSVKKMLDNHSLVFNSMVSRLHLDEGTDFHRGFLELSNELFGGDQVSWSKIIALFAFAARLAQYCEENNLGTMVFDVATNLSQFAVEKLTPFLRQHGGWVKINPMQGSREVLFSFVSCFQATLCEAFPMESDYESKIWHSLVITGLGLTAVATILALNHH